MAGSDHCSFFQLESDQLEVRELGMRPGTFRERGRQKERGLVSSIVIAGYTRRQAAREPTICAPYRSFTDSTWQCRDKEK